MLYVESGSPDLECEQGSLLLRRANLPRVAASPVATSIEAGRMVRLAAGDLAMPSARSRLVARNTTDRPAAILLLPIGQTGPASWLNPIRLLTLVLGVVAGFFAVDRARAVALWAGMIPSDGASNALAFAIAFAALLLAGATLAPAMPRVSALVFLLAAGIAGFLATASKWEASIEWWGASSVLTAWERLPLWSAGAVGLALLAFAGWRYHPHRRRRIWGRV
jgi:hypothetical protein